MPGEVLADEPRFVRHAVRRAALRREQQQVRRPHVARGDDERLRVKLHRRVGPVEARRDGVRDGLAAVLEHELPHERSRHQLDSLRPEQRVPGEVGRVLRADRADRRAGVVATALRPPAVGGRVLGRGLAPHRDAGLRRPRLEKLEVVREGNRRLRKRLLTRVQVVRALFSRHTHDLFGFLIERIELVVVDRPIRADAVQRALLEILGRKARRHRAPVHRQPADLHRARLQRTFDFVSLEVIASPRILAVAREPIARRGARRQRNGVVARLDDDDARRGRAREPVGDHRGADPRADDAHVALDDAARHRVGPSASGSGFRDCCASGRHVSRPMRAS